jgi:hypothetical protein
MAKPNYIPALLLLGGGALVYHMMRRKEDEGSMASAAPPAGAPAAQGGGLMQIPTDKKPLGPSKGVALVGDSLMKGAYANVKTAKSGEPVVGEPLLKMQKQINSIPPAAKIDALVISGGLNDLAGKASAADIVERAAKLWQNGLSRGWRVAHLELTPAGGGEYEKKISEDERVKANAALELAAKQAGVTFIKMSTFIDPTKPNMLKKEFAAADKLHLNPDGYKKLGALIDLWLGGLA